MLSWVVLNVILAIYSNATQSTYSLIGLMVMARRVIWIRSVRPSVQKFWWDWLFSFFRDFNIVLGAHVVLCMTEPDFLKKMFYAKNGEWNQDFSINHRTLKLGVSQKEINEINWFLVCPSKSFLRNGSLGFSDFWDNGR